MYKRHAPFRRGWELAAARVRAKSKSQGSTALIRRVPRDTSSTRRSISDELPLMNGDYSLTNVLYIPTTLPCEHTLRPSRDFKENKRYTQSAFGGIALVELFNINFGPNSCASVG